MIKKYIQFINENKDLPELNSFDELLDKGGKYSMQLRIEYPETTIV